MPLSSKYRYIILICGLWIAGCGAFGGTGFAATLKDELASIDANIVFMRHALAPGTGDPGNFDITNCNRQRNLDEAGRRQAKEAGDFFRAEQVEFHQILSSRWCRCTETASLLDLGPFTTFNGLNSFFNGHVDKAETIALLKQKLATLDRKSVTLLVTHQVVIRAITNISPSSGGLVLYNSDTKQAKSVRWQ